MSFLIYFFVLLVSAASVLFGLDLMTSPLPKTPNVPLGRSVQPATPAPKQEAQTLARMQAQNTKANERALTPVYPASPGPRQGQAATSGSATPEPATAAPQNARPDNQPAAEPAKSAHEQSPTAKVQPAVQQAPNRCNVQACAGAYRSFRTSDCTYQPFEGPRQLCSKGDGAATAAAEPAPAKEPGRQQAARKLSSHGGLTRAVRRRPLELRPTAAAPAQRAADSREMSEVERIVRHMTRDEHADIPVQDAEGNIIIIRKSDSYR
jgi:hypothetical protein